MLDSSELFQAIGGEEQPEKKDIIERLRFDDALEIPAKLTDIELWNNYINNDLYVMDKKVREYIKSIRWTKNNRGGFRTTASMVFAWIYGRLPRAEDGAACRIIHLLLKYYCSTYTGKTTIGGKRVERVYKFTRYGADHMRPYSLRLRLEECGENGATWKRNPGDSKDKCTKSRRYNSGPRASRNVEGGVHSGGDEPEDRVSENK